MRARSQEGRCRYRRLTPDAVTNLEEDKDDKTDGCSMLQENRDFAMGAKKKGKRIIIIARITSSRSDSRTGTFFRVWVALRESRPPALSAKRPQSSRSPRDTSDECWVRHDETPRERERCRITLSSHESTDLTTKLSMRSSRSLCLLWVVRKIAPGIPKIHGFDNNGSPSPKSMEPIIVVYSEARLS